MVKGLTHFFSQFKSHAIVAPTQMVGIDVGSSSVKIVELFKKDDVLTLKTYGELQLGPYAQQDMGSITRLGLSQKIEAVVDVLRESKAVSKSGVITLQLSTSFIIVLSLKVKENEDIGARINIEARKYIPVPMSDVTLDWSILPPLDKTVEESSVSEVLVVAVQNDARAENQQLLSAIKMNDQLPEIEIFSALRAVSKKEDTSLAIIDLGAQTSKLYISHEGIVRKIHRVFTGGSKATEQLAKVLNISFEEAEDRKRNYTTDSKDASEIKKTVIGVFERPLQEFKRVINQYELRTGQPIARIVIIGGSASFSEMHAYISYMLDRTVETPNTFSKVAYPAFMEDVLSDISPSFTVALGAALRQFEF